MRAGFTKGAKGVI